MSSWVERRSFGDPTAIASENFEKPTVLVKKINYRAHGGPLDLEIHQADLDEIRICYRAYGGGRWKRMVATSDLPYANPTSGKIRVFE